MYNYPSYPFLPGALGRNSGIFILSWDQLLKEKSVFLEASSLRVDRLLEGFCCPGSKVEVTKIVPLL